MSARRNFQDHGNAFAADGESYTYGEPPKFSVGPGTDEIVGRLAYEMQQNAKTALVHLNRLNTQLEQGFGGAAYAKAKAELDEAGEACMRALEAAIAKFTKTPALPDGERVIPSGKIG